MPLAKVQLMEAPGGPGITGAVKAGSGVTISADGTISASGGGGGTVTQISTTAPITGGTITGTGTIGLATSGVTAGSYTSANITVDAYGRITTASNGGGGGGVSSFSAGTTGLNPTSASTGAVTLSGILNIANGGTGSATKSWVDLTTAQSVAGLKTFTDSGGIKAAGFNDSAGSGGGYGFTGGTCRINGPTASVMSGASLDNFCNTANQLVELKTQAGYATLFGQAQVTVQTGGAAVVSVQWTVGSDQRWKTNINAVAPATVDAYKAAFKNLNFVTYELDQTVLGGGSGPAPLGDTTILGLIAQDVEAIEPDFVDTIDMSQVKTWDGNTNNLITPSHHYADTKCLKGGLQSVTQLLLQRALQDLDDLRAEFDAYVAAHP